jgi:hypothetical protein
MERLGPIVTDSSPLEYEPNLISPSASGDAHIDDIEEDVDGIEDHVDEIEELQKPLISFLIEVGNTGGTPLEEIFESRKHAWLHMALFSDDSVAY